MHTKGAKSKVKTDVTMLTRLAQSPSSALFWVQLFCNVELSISWIVHNIITHSGP